MRKENVEVMANILYAVETGGQVYGGRCYDDFTPAYKNSSAEHAITIGAGAWYATEENAAPEDDSVINIRTHSRSWTQREFRRIWIRRTGAGTSWTRLLQRQSASRRLSLLLMESSARMP